MYLGTLLQKSFKKVTGKNKCHYSCYIVILDNMYSYLKIKLKIAITALNCSDDLAS